MKNSEIINAAQSIANSLTLEDVQVIKEIVTKMLEDSNNTPEDNTRLQNALNNIETFVAEKENYIINPNNGKQIAVIEMMGKRWFDKINGNTYFHAVCNILHTDKTIETLVVPFQYGYGNHWEWVVTEHVKAYLQIQDEKYPRWFYEIVKNTSTIFTNNGATDTNRKGDLIGGFKKDNPKGFKYPYYITE